MRLKLTTLFAVIFLLAVTGCRELHDLLDEVEPRKPQLKEFVSGLSAPIGLSLDKKGRIWVTEIGTGSNDGKVTVIMPNGTRHVVVEGFGSAITPMEPFPLGLNHLLATDDILYILHVDGNLYKLNIGTYQPGDAPVMAGDLEKENIGTFVLDYDFEADTEESNPYNLTTGPNGDIFITDAAANAIIRRNHTGELSVFATIPDITNPTQVGPPMINSVPTGIAFNGSKFFVSSLIGFPFPPEKARIYQIDLSGNTSVYQEGFTSLVDIILSANHQPVVVQYGQFGEQGFSPNTGRVIRTTGKKTTVLAEKLNLPTSIVRSGAVTYYINSMADGKIQKIIYAHE